MSKTVMVDIDGVLTDYPGCFLRWVEQFTGINYVNVQVMKSVLGIPAYEIIKEQYRDSGVKRSLPLNQDAFEILVVCKRMDYIILVVTTRPDREPVRTDTMFWLHDKHIPYDNVFFVTDKKEFVKEHTIDIIMDDEMDKLVN